MKRGLKFALFVALGTGVLGTGAVAQNRQTNDAGRTQLPYATFNGNQAGLLQQTDWDDHRRCDGDGDRDDRRCYQYQQQYPSYGYHGGGYYSNGYYVTPAPYYPPNSGWYDRNGHWHAYGRDRDRDHDRDRHDRD